MAKNPEFVKFDKVDKSYDGKNISRQRSSIRY